MSEKSIIKFYALENACMMPANIGWVCRALISMSQWMFKITKCKRIDRWIPNKISNNTHNSFAKLKSRNINSTDVRDVFINAARFNNPYILSRVIKLFPNIFAKYPILIISLMQTACLSTALKSIKWLLNYHPNYVIAIYYCSTINNYRLINWITSLTNDISVSEMQFQMACQKGSRKYIRYLSTYPIDFPIKPTHLLCNIILRWDDTKFLEEMIEIFDIDIEEYLDDIFQTICTENAPRTLEWLYNKNIDLSDANIPKKSLIYHAVYNHNMSILHFLHSKHIEINWDNPLWIKTAIKYDHCYEDWTFVMIKWLFKRGYGDSSKYVKFIIKKYENSLIDKINYINFFAPKCDITNFSVNGISLYQWMINNGGDMKRILASIINHNHFDLLTDLYTNNADVCPILKTHLYKLIRDIVDPEDIFTWIVEHIGLADLIETAIYNGDRDVLRIIIVTQHIYDQDIINMINDYDPYILEDPSYYYD